MYHKFELNNMKIVIDVNSGAVHVVDDIVYELIDMFGIYSIEDISDKLSSKFDKKSINEAYNEIERLKEQGLLFSEDTYKDSVTKGKSNLSLKALCLNIAHDCNIRCKYCFATTGNYHGGRKLMTLDIAKKSIDFLLNNSGSRRRLEVDFFGGEPLLNFDVIKETINYARTREKLYNKRIGFTMTTNATLLNDEIIDFLNENMDNVVLSIDGRAEINDAMRYFVDGTGIYESIMPRIKSFVNKRGDKSYYIRGTFTSNNLDFTQDVISLVEEGFKEVSIEPVVADADKPYAIREEHIDVICTEYEKLANKYLEYKNIGKEFKFYHFLMDLDGGPCVYKRISACGSGVEYFAVTPDGELYPCHQFVGKEKYKLGDIYNGVTNTELQKNFMKNTIYDKTKCSNCWAKFYCSGGCMANAVSFNNDLKEPYDIECSLQKKRIECAIMIKAYNEIY